MAACVDKRLRASHFRRNLTDICTVVAAASTNSTAVSRTAAATAVATEEDDHVWAELRAEAESDAACEPILRNYYHEFVLSHDSLECALSAHLAAKLSLPGAAMSRHVLQELLHSTYVKDGEVWRAIRADLWAAFDRDPACAKMVHCFLYYKGFLALQAHRAAHLLWAQGRVPAALMLQSRTSEVFGVDIHPGARIGRGVLLDHATGVVIGETAVVGDDVSILHGVTLGGTGKASGDRHPKVGDGVLLGAGVSVLGNVRIGAGSKIGAGAVVLRDVPPGSTAVGNPARALVKAEPTAPRPGVTMENGAWKVT